MNQKNFRFFDRAVTVEGIACFVSDAHLGAPSEQLSQEREEKLVTFLSQHPEIQHLFLLGDIFDFWFEYQDVVPKGYFKLFNILSEMHRRGTRIYYFTGNHDMWVQDYFVRELGFEIFRQQQAFLINGKRCMVGHGDGIGGRQWKYLFIKKIFSLKLNRVIYSMLHPRLAFSIARLCSNNSRKSHPESAKIFQKEAEPQVQFARTLLQHEQVDFFIYAHRHIPIIYPLTKSTCYCNVGDWLTHFSYLWFANQTPELCYLDKCVDCE